MYEKCFISCLSTGKWMGREHQEMKGEEHNIMKLRGGEETRSTTGLSRFPRSSQTAVWTAPRLEQAKEASCPKLVTTFVT